MEWDVPDSACLEHGLLDSEQFRIGVVFETIPARA